MSKIRETAMGITLGLTVLTSIGVGAWLLGNHNLRRNIQVKDAHDYCECVPPELWNEKHIPLDEQGTLYSCTEVNGKYHRIFGPHAFD